MGASGWLYSVPYQPDTNQAFQALRQQVFEDGDYFKPDEWYKELYKLGIVDDEELNDTLKELAMEPQPKTIQELLELRGHTGTHSILDIEIVSPTPALGAISPLTAEEHFSILGTDRPTRDVVKQKES